MDMNKESLEFYTRLLGLLSEARSMAESVYGDDFTLARFQTDMQASPFWPLIQKFSKTFSEPLRPKLPEDCHTSVFDCLFKPGFHVAAHLSRAGDACYLVMYNGEPLLDGATTDEDCVRVHLFGQLEVAQQVRERLIDERERYPKSFPSDLSKEIFVSVTARECHSTPQ